MKDIFKPGDIKLHRKRVEIDDIAHFEAGVVHKVCSTFVLAREMEWASRLFVLEMKEEHEEGIDTMLQINHLSPALPEEELLITAEYQSLEGNKLVCSIKVEANRRLIATGQTAQKILNKARIASIFHQIENTQK